MMHHRYPIPSTPIMGVSIAAMRRKIFHQMAETMLALGEFMVEAEPGSGEVDLTGGGQSSGGTWDTLPTAADSEILGGLVPVYDYDLLVSNQPIEPEASPAS